MSNKDNSYNFDTSEPQSIKIGIYVVGISLLLTAVCVASIFLYETAISEELNSKEGASVSHDLLELRAMEAENLVSLKWIDKSKGSVKVSKDIAKQLVIKDYQKKS